MKKDYFVHSTATIEKKAKVGKGTKIWHFSHVDKGAVLGENCKLGRNVYIGPDVKIGKNVKIQNNVSVYAGVELEDDVFCGPSMVFTNIINPRSAVPRNNKEFYKKTLVKKGATIGANATVVCGNTLGTHSFVGAGSVVTKDVPGYALAYGNPACFKGWMCTCGERLIFNKDKAICKSCKAKYQKTGSTIRPAGKR